MASHDHVDDGEEPQACPHCSGKGSGMNDDQFGNLVAAILTAGTLAASHRGLIEARAVPTHFFQVRSELRAAGIIHRNRTYSRKNGSSDLPKMERRARDQFGEVG
jgi:hypothetical protein